MKYCALSHVATSLNCKRFAQGSYFTNVKLIGKYLLVYKTIQVTHIKGNIKNNIILEFFLGFMKKKRDCLDRYFSCCLLLFNFIWYAEHNLKMYNAQKRKRNTTIVTCMFCEKVLDKTYLLKLNNVSQTSSKRFVETPSICLFLMSVFCSFLCFKLYLLNLAIISHAQKRLLCLSEWVTIVLHKNKNH